MRTRSNSFSGKVQDTFSVEMPNPIGDKKRKSNSRRSVATADATRDLSERSSAEHRDSSKSGTSAVYDRRSIPTSLSGQDFATVSDDDLTMVEVGDMRIAEELFCKRHLRPPLPVGIPDSEWSCMGYIMTRSKATSNDMI